MHCCSFSYSSDDTFVFHIDGGLQGRISRIDANIARIYFVRLDPSEGFVQVPVPASLRLHDTTNRATVPVHNKEFLIACTGSYELRMGEVTLLSLDAQRQQAIRTRFEGGILD